MFLDVTLGFVFRGLCLGGLRGRGGGLFGGGEARLSESGAGDDKSHSEKNVFHLCCSMLPYPKPGQDRMGGLNRA
jgi:hypothetical protein